MAPVLMAGMVALHRISAAGLQAVRRSATGFVEGSEIPFWYPR